jgi:hypothetical protein
MIGGYGKINDSPKLYKEQEYAITFVLKTKFLDIRSPLKKLYLASSEWIPARYPKYITGTYRRSIHAQTVSDCFKAYNTVYAVKYPFFAQF